VLVEAGGERGGEKWECTAGMAGVADWAGAGRTEGARVWAGEVEEEDSWGISERI